jgi:hypothetical protein
MKPHSATIEFNVTSAEKTIAWFYSGEKQPTYQKARLAFYGVLPNGVEVHRGIKAMLFKCRGHLASVHVYSALGVWSVRIDDAYGWPYIRGEERMGVSL